MRVTAMRVSTTLRLMTVAVSLLGISGAVMPALAQEKAQEYKTGTVGHLYEDCKSALRDSDSLLKAHDTYCGAFAEGYFMGAMTVNTPPLQNPPEGSACFEDMTREYERINNRFCTNLPHFDPSTVKPEEFMRSVLATVSQWASMNSSKMNQSATTALGTLVQSGEFCDSLPAENPSDLDVNPALIRLRWNDILGVRRLVSHQKKYEMCKADIEAADGKPAVFRETRCGAEISGFIAGLHATAHLQASRDKPSDMCEKRVDRLYNAMDVTQTMCVQATTDPLFVARIFVENFEIINRQKGVLANFKFYNPGALGAVGYETIYRGFLCRNEYERAQNRKR